MSTKRLLNLLVMLGILTGILLAPALAASLPYPSKAPTSSPSTGLRRGFDGELSRTAQSSRSGHRPPPAPLAQTAGPAKDGSVDQAWQHLPPAIKAKVDPRILAELRGEITPAHLGGGHDQADMAPLRKPLDKTRFLVHLKATADLEPITRWTFATRVAQRTAVFNALVSTAQSTQGPVKLLLNARMSQGDVASYQPFYIFNGFAVEGNLDTIIELAQRDDVERIVANYRLIPLWNNASAAASPVSGLGGLPTDNWNIDLVDAERVWNEFGITGQGAVVGGIDTGVHYTHPALVGKYRGNLGSGTFDHNYNWFDPDPTLYPDGDLGPSRSAAPFDDDEHGTHTMGTMVGDGGTPGTQVGMAPGSRWIAISLNAMVIEGYVGDDIMAHKAFQWMLCPTDLSGALATADCSKAPDAVNNSWGSANPADDTLRPDIQALRAAGVAPVFAGGNPSAGPGSIGSPGSAPEAITVGATDDNDTVASFSGRGPSFYEGEQKPELTAPGVSVKSTVPNASYDSYSGTSMAAPHVAGLVALMAAADLQDGRRDFNVDELERFMEYTAVDLGAPGPDDDYGYGRIDAYHAVRWARSAGDLRGTVRDATTSTPIEGATVSGVATNPLTALRPGSGQGSGHRPGDTFTVWTDSSGLYSTTVPAGSYNVTVEAWGYYGDTFSSQTVITGVLSIADFSLTPMPTAVLTGKVLADSMPIGGALVYVAAKPSLNATTGPDGAYTLTLPIGTHGVVVEAAGYRILREDVSVASGGSSHDFSMLPAPTILLVDADTWLGWFVGWPVHNYFQWSLDQENYLYDVWQVQYLDFNDTQVMPDGSLGYGIPSTSTLSSYNLVIWAHTATSPGEMGATAELMDFMDSGGRLILSGQDIGYYDNGTYFYDYLHADYVMDIAADEGDSVSGSDFLDGLSLEITNASLYGYPNNVLNLWPDAVALQDGAAFPVLTYDNGYAAALAIDPCTAPYRAVYFPVGYESIAPRAYNRDPAIAEVLDRSIQWLRGSKPSYGVGMVATPSRQMGDMGGTATYDLQVINKGTTIATIELDLTGNVWNTRILDGATEVTLVADLPSCGLQNLTLEVDVPATADPGEEDTATITASLYPAGTPSASAHVTTAAFPAWQIETPMSTPRYRLGAAALPGDIYYYAIGGQPETNLNERYNACTGQWEVMAPLPQALGNVGVAALDGKVYVVGGYTSEPIYYDTVHVYDPATDAWSRAANLPQALAGVAVAGANGKLYAFGGGDEAESVDKTYEYDPATDAWTEKAPLPGGPRNYAAAAELNGQIYVAGGWENVRTVEVYDPATDSWSTAAPMKIGRQSPGLTAAPDGYLYVSGGGNGWTGLNSAERYDPTADTWEIIPALNNAVRAGSASAYAAGQVFAIGGGDSDAGWTNANESLRLYDAFCTSNKYAWQSVVQPGDRITYTIETHADAVALMDASLVDPIPAGTSFAGFGVNPIGATYNSGDNQVEWSGAIPAHADPLTFTFGVEIDALDWTFGDPITNTVTFDSGEGVVLTRTAVSVLEFPDASPSTKMVDKSQALPGDVLTYTVHIENRSVISDVFTLRDPIPPDTTYVPGSLAYDAGSGAYDPVANVVNWTGALSGHYDNTNGDYEWGDSDGNGTVSGVTFDWIDISSTGANAGSGDDAYYCDRPIGFTFNFYDTDETTFCASTNGFVSFDTSGISDLSNDCPLPDASGNAAIIAGIWDDLVTSGGIYYQTFGTAPNRYLVVQWVDVRHYGGSTYFDFQIILYENGAIKVQLLDAGPDLGSGSTTGIEDYTETQGISYACDTLNSLHDNLAVIFQPIRDNRADLTFAVTTAAVLPANTWITNTATISGPYDKAVERSAATLVNSVDLSTSWKQADKTQAVVGDVVTYDFSLENTGLLTATGATLNDPIPANTAYAPGSLVCSSGSCSFASGVVNWTGDITPSGGVALTFAVTLTASLDDLTPVSNVATLNDGYGNLYALEAVFMARSSDLSGSFKQVVPTQVEPGDTVTFTVYAYNSGAGAVGSEMRDELPPALTYVPGSLACGSGSCSEASDVITWMGTAYPRSMTPVQFQATVPVGASHGDLITNTALVTDTANGLGYPVAATVEVVKPVDLWLSKSGATGVDANATLVYTLTYGNAGPYDADDSAQVVDVLPASMTYVGSSPSGVYSATAGTVAWDVGALSAGISGTLILTAGVPAGVPPLTVLTNTASISVISQDLNAANNESGLGTVVGSNVNLLNSVKEVEPLDVLRGDVVTYTITLVNIGNLTATVTITDPIPSGVRYILGSSQVDGASTALYNDVDDRIEWHGLVSPGSVVPLRFQAQITAAGGTVVTNVVAINDGAGLTFSRQAGIWIAYTPVQADFTASPAAGVTPLTVVFTNTSSGDYTTNLWDFGDGVTDTQQNPTHTYAAMGVYTVTLIVSGPGGTDTETKAEYITVRAKCSVYLPLILRNR